MNMTVNTLDFTDIFKRVDMALDEIRPHLQVDGGDIEVVEITENLIVKVRWMGNCESCNMSLMTMRAGVEQAIKNKVPEITGVVAINGIQS
jgi:Fe-S cluster biogenesis protein NfuA